MYYAYNKKPEYSYPVAVYATITDCNQLHKLLDDIRVYGAMWENIKRDTIEYTGAGLYHKKYTGTWKKVEG